jgi:hypothetical protein
MPGKVGISLGSVALCVALSHCAGDTKVAKAPETVEATSEEKPKPQPEGGEGGAPPAEEAKPSEHAGEEPEHALVARAVDKTGETKDSDESELGLRFEVAELGPEAWAYAIVNRGTEKVAVAADPRLLRFELVPPPDPNAKRWAPKPKTKTCELPSELRPGVVDRHFVVVLQPGQGVVEAFDPRLYCLPEGGVSPLVPGARLTPRFGFAPKTKTVWKAGKREITPLPEQVEPFVARRIDDRHHRDRDHHHRDRDEAHDAGGAGGAAHGEPGPKEEKELVGSVLELGADYAPKKVEEEPLSLTMTRGSDARDERQALVTVSLTNHQKKPLRVYFRRELVSFQVIGPDGSATCSPEPDARAPDRGAFSLLNPGGSVTATSRLVELCPEGTFARPGLYLIQGRFDATENGKEYGFDGFVGTVASSKPAVVRLRSGSLPFPGKRRSKLVRLGESGGLKVEPEAEPKAEEPDPKAKPPAPEAP